jgi:uncharacterized protein YegL
MAKKLPTLEDILGSESIDDDLADVLPKTDNVGFTHLPVLILLDTSGSMAGNNAIGQVKSAIEGFLSNVANPKDEFHRKLHRQGDFCILRYGGTVQTALDWTSGQSLPLDPKLPLLADGNTPMGEAIVQSADQLLNRYRGYKLTRTRAFCGLVFNLTDGVPTDMDPNGNSQQREMWDKARGRVRLFETMGSNKNPYAQYIHFGTDRTSCDFLRTFSGDAPVYNPSGSTEEVMQRVNLLEGSDSFGRFVRFIEMSMNSIMSGDG